MSGMLPDPPSAQVVPRPAMVLTVPTSVKGVERRERIIDEPSSPIPTGVALPQVVQNGCGSAAEDLRASADWNREDCGGRAQRTGTGPAIGKVMGSDEPGSTGQKWVCVLATSQVMVDPIAIVAEVVQLGDGMKVKDQVKWERGDAQRRVAEDEILRMHRKQGSCLIFAHPVARNARNVRYQDERGQCEAEAASMCTPREWLGCNPEPHYLRPSSFPPRCV
ncbi:uncharacterized protein B0T23DRAFT_442013 [Neurospora hispaniola]|uniref:Uncharacterized protein n=1 Tax=Neurospora hispaniola TaxID=588809 RepID=A0AAJ0MR86_9PEZI|nr:hypothetical protein B0T23DRAFT_442013 [Neurospora hispaniola]